MREYKLYNGNCLEELKKLPDNSVDSIVTDPPYGLSYHSQKDVVECLTAWISGKEYDSSNKTGFMQKPWDSWVPGPEVWKECLRVLKPGGHILAFAGTRSMDLMSMAIRLSGFELRDNIGYAHDSGEAPLLAWVYSSGMPKSSDIGKQIHNSGGTEKTQPDDQSEKIDISQKWKGWATLLKPAWEPIVIARKPLSESTVAINVLKWGTGAINIDGCRIDGRERTEYGLKNSIRSQHNTYSTPSSSADFDSSKGRYPPNVILDGSDEVVNLLPDSDGAGKSLPNVKITGYGDKNTGTGKSEYFGGERIPFDAGTGSAARFFYCAKASSKDRHSGLTPPGKQFKHGTTLRKVEDTDTSGNSHPTVKPQKLMSWLCRLVTPPNGTVLDPFMGSGSTGKAAMLEGFNFIGIELNPEYVEIAEARIKHAKENPDFYEEKPVKNTEKTSSPKDGFTGLFSSDE